MVEQWTENPCVPGSIPGGTTKCSDGEIGRHAGLKIQWTAMFVRVQVPLWVQKLQLANADWSFFVLKIKNSHHLFDFCIITHSMIVIFYKCLLEVYCISGVNIFEMQCSLKG